MLRVLPAEAGEILARLELQVGRERGRLQVGFLELDLRLVVLVQFQDDVAKALEIGIDRAVDGDLRVAQRKAALDGIVVAELQLGGRIRGAGPAGVNQRAVTDVHVGGARPRLGQGRDRRSRCFSGPGGRRTSRHLRGQFLLERLRRVRLGRRGGGRLTGQLIQFPGEGVDLLLLLAAGLLKIVLHLLQLPFQLLDVVLRRPRRDGEEKGGGTRDESRKFHGYSGTQLLLGWAQDTYGSRHTTEVECTRVAPYEARRPESGTTGARQLNPRGDRAPAAAGSAANPEKLPVMRRQAGRATPPSPAAARSRPLTPKLRSRIAQRRNHHPKRNGGPDAADCGAPDWR